MLLRDEKGRVSRVYCKEIRCQMGQASGVIGVKCDAIIFLAARVGSLEGEERLVAVCFALYLKW